MGQFKPEGTRPLTSSSRALEQPICCQFVTQAPLFAARIQAPVVVEADTTAACIRVSAPRNGRTVTIAGPLRWATVTGVTREVVIGEINYLIHISFKDVLCCIGSGVFGMRLMKTVANKRADR
jgi:hypothetical protein